MSKRNSLPPNEDSTSHMLYCLMRPEPVESIEEHVKKSVMKANPSEESGNRTNDLKAITTSTALPKPATTPVDILTSHEFQTFLRAKTDEIEIILQRLNKTEEIKRKFQITLDAYKNNAANLSHDKKSLR